MTSQLGLLSLPNSPGFTVVGMVVGMLAALLLTGAMRSMLVGVAPTDPMTFVTVTLAFLGIAALACWSPSRRAVALRLRVNGMGEAI